MIHPTEPAVRRPDVRRILRCLLRLMGLTARMAASTPVIILVIQTVRRVLRLPTPEVAAVRPVTGVTPKPVIILINPVVRRVVPIPQALVPAALTRFPTAAAELADVVNLVAVRLLIIGAPFTRHVMATAVLTEPWNHVIRNAEVQDAAAREEALEAEVVLRAVLVHLIPAVTDKTELYYPVRPDTGYVPPFPLAPA